MPLASDNSPSLNRHKFQDITIKPVRRLWSAYAWRGSFIYRY